MLSKLAMTLIEPLAVTIGGVKNWVPWQENGFWFLVKKLLYLSL